MSLDQRVRELEIAAEMGRCVHFRGIQHDLCGAGVHVRELVGGPDFGWAVRTPCLSTHEKCDVVCDQRKFPTREEAEAEVRRSDEQVSRTLAVVLAAKADAKTKGFQVGNGGVSSMACPTRCGGTLHYSVAGVNGHMHGRCSTEGCVSWME